MNDGKLAFERNDQDVGGGMAFAGRNIQLTDIVKVLDGHVETFKPGAKVVSQITSVGLKAIRRVT